MVFHPCMNLPQPTEHPNQYVGLFQCSGAFITSEERSIAFWLSEHGCVCGLVKCTFSNNTNILDIPTRGYQVFLGNTRAIFGMGHTVFSRSDPRFWGMNIQCPATYFTDCIYHHIEDWTIRDLAMYDLPALVNHVCHVTGYSKVLRLHNFPSASQRNVLSHCR
jgi:lysosomal acid lipase/cholesteryl ester hydrolase